MMKSPDNLLPLTKIRCWLILGVLAQVEKHMPDIHSLFGNKEIASFLCQDEVSLF
jgi:hypothetical protein